VYIRDLVDYATQCPFRESDVDWSSIDYGYPEGQDPYGVGKRHCEKWLQENSHIPFTVIRVPAVFGRDDPTARMWWWVQRALDGGGVSAFPLSGATRSLSNERRSHAQARPVF